MGEAGEADTVGGDRRAVCEAFHGQWDGCACEGGADSTGRADHPGEAWTDG